MGLKRTDEFRGIGPLQQGIHMHKSVIKWVLLIHMLG